MRKQHLRIVSVMCASFLAACGGGGGGGGGTTNAVVEGGEQVTTPISPQNPDAPSVPANVRVTAVSANSVTLAWDASTGGKGGLHSYRIRRADMAENMGLAIVPAQPAASTYRYPGASSGEFPLNPQTEYTFRVSAVSVSGAESASVEVKATTLGFDTMKSKLNPYIVVSADGTVFSQVFVSQQALAVSYSSLIGGHIQHAPIDLTIYGIRKSTDVSYEIYDNKTGAAVETGLVRTPVPSFSNEQVRRCVVVSIKTGEVRFTGGCDLIQVSNPNPALPPPPPGSVPITSDFGMYLLGESL